MIVSGLPFIILARPHLLSNLTPLSDEIPSQEEISKYPMIGDVNLYLRTDSDGNDDLEVEVMVAGAVLHNRI